MIEFGFTPCPYHVINCKVKIPKPYKPRNLHDKKRHDMYMRKLLNRKSKMTIKVDYSKRATGEWYDAVLYDDANGQYVREVNDFNNKFKKVTI